MSAHALRETCDEPLRLSDIRSEGDALTRRARRVAERCLQGVESAEQRGGVDTRHPALVATGSARWCQLTPLVEGAKLVGAPLFTAFTTARMTSGAALAAREAMMPQIFSSATGGAAWGSFAGGSAAPGW